MTHFRSGNLYSYNYEIEEARESLKLYFENNPTKKDEVLSLLELNFSSNDDLKEQLVTDRMKALNRQKRKAEKKEKLA